MYLVIFRPLGSCVYIRGRGWWEHDRRGRESLKVSSRRRDVWCQSTTTSPLIRAVVLDPQLIQQALGLLKLPVDANLEAVPGHGARSCSMSEGPARGLVIVVVSGEVGVVISAWVTIHSSSADARWTQNAPSSCLCWTLGTIKLQLLVVLNVKPLSGRHFGIDFQQPVLNSYLQHQLPRKLITAILLPFISIKRFI